MNLYYYLALTLLLTSALAFYWLLNRSESNVPVKRSVLDSLKNFRRSSSEGFRLQIFETVSKHSADTTLAYFQKTLEDTVYLIFEAPLYKLHFGNFLTKKEAEIQKIKLNRLGFKDIWIVRSRIHQN